MDAEASEREHAAQKAARKERAPGAKAGVNAANKTGNVGSGNSNDTSGTGNHADEEDDSAMRQALCAAGCRVFTGVRHWSTPDYTRVAIDVEGRKSNSIRSALAHPDRIFFDLRDTRLAQLWWARPSTSTTAS